MKEIIVKGRVQGVCFRYFVKNLANELGLRGSVENLENGSVKILVIYDDLDIYDMFLSQIKMGPEHAEVNEIEEKEVKNKEFLNFSIVY